MSFFGKFKPGSVSEYCRTSLLLDRGDNKGYCLRNDQHADKGSRQ